MPEEWFVRVQGKEYGPVDLDELRDWRDEGRLIPANELRTPESEQWFLAEDLPELFPPFNPATAERGFASQATLREILARSWQIYRQGFWQFLGLSALVIVPSICTQISRVAAGSPAAVSLDLRTVLAGLFNFAMFITSLVVWPIYLAGIQILTAERSRDQSPALSKTISRAAFFWPRVAPLCVLVYGAFFLLLAFAFAILLMIGGAAESPFAAVVALVALVLLFFQIWMFGRLFASTLFWQQTAVLEDAGMLDSLRQSHALAGSGRDQSWFCRPLWRGAVLSSLWFLVTVAFTLGPEWSTISELFHLTSTLQDPQAILQAVSAHAASNADTRMLPLILGVAQTVLRPLLGISFVLLYFDAKARK